MQQYQFSLLFSLCFLLILPGGFIIFYVYKVVTSACKLVSQTKLKIHGALKIHRKPLIATRWQSCTPPGLSGIFPTSRVRLDPGMTIFLMGSGPRGKNLKRGGDGDYFTSSGMFLNLQNSSRRVWEYYPNPRTHSDNNNIINIKINNNIIDINKLRLEDSSNPSCLRPITIFEAEMGTGMRTRI